MSKEVVGFDESVKHGAPCPYCGQTLHIEHGVFECGGEGEGTCSIWSAIGDYGRTAQRLPKSATLDVERWIDEWIVDAIGVSWTEVGWDREQHLRGVRAHWSLT